MPDALGEMARDDRLPVRFRRSKPRDLQGSLDLSVIGPVKLRGARTVPTNRFAPRLVGAEQLVQEPRVIGRVRRRIESGFEVVEGIGVVQQVDLHATNIDVSNTNGLQAANMFDRGGLGRKESPILAVRHGPGSGENCPLRFAPAAGLDLRDRGNQGSRTLLGTLDFLDRGRTNIMGIQKVGACRRDDGDRRDETQDE